MHIIMTEHEMERVHFNVAIITIVCLLKVIFYNGLKEKFTPKWHFFAFRQRKVHTTKGYSR